MPKTIRPKRNDVIIHPIEPPEKIGSLYVPDSVKTRKRVNQGIIVALGSEVEDLEVADHVVFSGYTGDKIIIEDSGVFYVAHASHIDAVLLESDVVLMDSEQVKDIIRGRISELRHGANEEQIEILEDLEISLINRINTWTIAEGFEF